MIFSLSVRADYQKDKETEPFDEHEDSDYALSQNVELFASMILITYPLFVISVSVTYQP